APSPLVAWSRQESFFEQLIDKPLPYRLVDRIENILTAMGFALSASPLLYTPGCFTQNDHIP
ncbi:MAG: hypothetical protein MUP68_08385, partial [Deltaproteobacteria bacterium]|nr:hypothetical protein [Deltaproteobacteria bacterium]